MSGGDATPGRDEVGAAVEAARAGDERAFAVLVARYQRELQLHCYRMVGSFEDSEDLAQETFVRAWRNRASFEGRSSFRAWLYRIATNACLDALERHPRRARRLPAGAEPGGAPPNPAEIPWLQPYPDRLLEGIGPSDAEPEAAVVARETIELAFLAAIQHLLPRQRAVLLLRDVLGLPAKDTAALLETSVPSVNSALQRARATLRRRLPARRLEWAPASEPSAEERELLRRYIEAHERADAAAVAALLREDVRLTMPPQPAWYEGRAAVAAFFAGEAFGPGSPGAFRLVPTRANRQPAAANYVRRPGDTAYRALSLDVLRFEGGGLAEITVFAPSLFPAFGLPPAL
jgi:RNA polymerase sigma-70 factor (ECF subfamily)